MWNKAPEAVDFCGIVIRVFSYKQQKMVWLIQAPKEFIKNTLVTSQTCQ